MLVVSFLAKGKNIELHCRLVQYDYGMNILSAIYHQESVNFMSSFLCHELLIRRNYHVCELQNGGLSSSNAKYCK